MPQAALTFTSDTALDSFALDPATGVVTVTKALVTPVVTTLQVTATDSRPTCVVAVGPNAVETGEPCTSQPATLEVRMRLCVCLRVCVSVCLSVCLYVSVCGAPMAHVQVQCTPSFDLTSFHLVECIPDCCGGAAWLPG